jgi:hypothetical protein
LYAKDLDNTSIRCTWGRRSLSRCKRCVALPLFLQLFKALDAAQASLGFEAYGVSVTTLEEVFLKVRHHHHDDDDGHDHDHDHKDLAPCAARDNPRLTTHSYPRATGMTRIIMATTTVTMMTTMMTVVMLIPTTHDSVVRRPAGGAGR